MSCNPIDSVGVFGAPVTFVSFPSKECYLYGQGGFLHRVRSTSKSNSDEKCRVLRNASLHGIGFLESCTVTYGGRYLAFLNNVCDLSMPMETIRVMPDKNDPLSKAENTFLALSDWILACQVLPVDGEEMGKILVVGLAHTTVQLWKVSRENDRVALTLVHAIKGSQQSIAYSMTFHPTSGRMAFGTCFHDVLVSSFARKLEHTAKAKNKVVSLKAHQGPVHGLAFDATGTMLCSTSGDRSVRLWRYEDSWSLVWTAWGHGARGWAVLFSEVGVLSTSEDGTLRIWDVDSGAAIAVLKGHAHQWIRSVDSFESWAITGADDGTVAVFDLFCRIPTSHGGSFSKTTFRLPPDVDDESGEGQQISTTRSTQITGMAFYTQESGVSPSLLVATDSGAMITFVVGSQKWVHHPRWRSPQDSKTECTGLSPHPHLPVVAIGTNVGNILIRNLDRKALVSNCRTVLSGGKYRRVQKLKWINETVLLSFHVKSVILWSLPELNRSSLLAAEPEERSEVFQIDSRGIPSAVAFSHNMDRVVVGDTSGALHFFLRRGDGISYVVQSHTTLKNVHWRQHVTDILWTKKNRIISVGNDHCIHECIFKNDAPQSLTSTSLNSFSGITNIWEANDGGTSRIILGGYMGNTFRILDYGTSYELLSVDTVSRQLMLLLDIESSSCTFRCRHVALRKENDEIDLFSFYCSEGMEPYSTTSPIGFPIPRTALHGETIFDIKVFPVNERGLLAVLTGSEDCTSRLSFFLNGILQKSISLSPQQSGIRTVSSSAAANGSHLLVVGGGLNSVQFFSFTTKGVAGEDALLRYVGHSSRHKQKSLCSQRVNSVSAVALYESIDRTNCTHLVVAGDSSGSCKFYVVVDDALKHKRPFRGTELYQCDRAILSTHLVKYESWCILLVGTTDGSLLVFDMSSFLVKSMSVSSPVSLLLSISLHDIGTNAIATTILLRPNGVNGVILRVCTGGDDQSLTFFDLCSPGWSLLRKQSKRGASLSAIKGVCFVDEETIACIGYDQTLQLWRWNEDGIFLLEAASTTVGDVNCFDRCRINDKQYFGVGGNGIELFTTISY